MIDDKIRTFYEMRAKLIALLTDRENGEFRSLDAEIDAIFEEIYLYTPSHINEFRSVILFLLDRLALSEGGGDVRLISRLEDLVNQMTTLFAKDVRFLATPGKE